MLCCSEVNAADETGNTAIMLASIGGHTAVIEALIACGAEVNVATGYLTLNAGIHYRHDRSWS